MNRYEFIDSIIQKYESWSGNNMEQVCKSCAKELQRAGFGRSDVQEYFAKDGIYNEETSEGTWDKGFVDCVINSLPINSSRKITSVRANELTEQEKDELYKIEKDEAEEYYNSLDDSDKQMLRVRYGIKNAKDYVKFFIVHPNKLSDDYEFMNDPRTKLNSRKPVESSRKITSARNTEPANEDDVREITMFIENDGQLYRQMIVPVIKNLERKVNKGDFDKEKALIAWQHVADEGTKKYNKEFGSGKDSVLPFNTATRKEVAKQLADHYEENYKGDNPINSAKETKAEENGPHMQFKELSPDEKADLREQIEDELEAQLNKLHVKFDIDTWDNTVEYILSFFEEDNGYNPKDAKMAVHEWYLDTKDEFPEMFEQDAGKKKIASALYNSRISGKVIKSSCKPIKSAKSFTKGDNWKNNTAVLPTSKSMLKSFFEDGSWSWDDTVALVGHIDSGRPYVIFGAKGKYPKLENGRGLFHDQTLNDIGWFTFERYCNDDSVFNIPQARYAVLK